MMDPIKNIVDLYCFRLQNCKIAKTYSLSLDYIFLAAISRHELSSATVVSSPRYFAVYPITGGLSNRSIEVARRVKLAFRQVSDWQSFRRKGRDEKKEKGENCLEDETNRAFVVDIFRTKN